MKIIEVDNLVKVYGKGKRALKAVDGVNFSVEEGEIFGFLGPNGAGKTTTINILCTLLLPTSGRALVAGHDVVRQQAAVRKSIGLVFQDPTVDEQLTAEENLLFHAILYNIEPASKRRARMETVLKMVELYERRKDTLKTFSGGMKRRLEIARGLMHYPRVLFLDEPTLGLDPQTRHHIWSYILELRERENITIFLTTHYMDEAEFADRIAIIDHGKIIALDTPDALKSMVARDVITVHTADDERMAEIVREQFGLDVRRNPDGRGFSFKVDGGAEFIPKFVEQSPVHVLSISLRRPTLDDVFLELTGRQIRDEEVTDKDRMRQRARMPVRGHIAR